MCHIFRLIMPHKAICFIWEFTNQLQVTLLRSIAKISVSQILFACTANNINETSCAGGRHNMPQPPVTLTFDLLILKVTSESRVMWATSMPIIVVLGLSVLD